MKPASHLPEDSIAVMKSAEKIISEFISLQFLSRIIKDALANGDRIIQMDAV